MLLTLPRHGREAIIGEHYASRNIANELEHVNHDLFLAG